MIYVVVEDVEAFHTHISLLINGNLKFEKRRVNAPKQEPHIIVSFVRGPSGVLIHFDENLKNL